MIRYDAEQRVVTMGLVDLEHCGFDCEQFDNELFLAGIDNDEARNPKTLIVNFEMGHVRLLEQET